MIMYHYRVCIKRSVLFHRVSLTYRVKSAHKVKLTDKQLLQWMVPILLVMLIYLGTWTLSAPPYAEVIADNYGLKFYQCSFNWWDHSLAIGNNKCWSTLLIKHILTTFETARWSLVLGLDDKYLVFVRNFCCCIK